MSIKDTVIRLNRLANDPSAPEGERKAAGKALQRLVEKNPELQHSLAQTLDEDRPGEQDFRFKLWHEEWLLVYIANFLGLEVYNLTSRAAKRRVKWLRLKGDTRLLAMVKPLFKDYKDDFYTTMEMFAMGWLARTFPPQKSGEGGRELTEEEMAIFRAGADLGKRHDSPFPKLHENNAKGAIED